MRRKYIFSKTLVEKITMFMSSNTFIRHVTTSLHMLKTASSECSWFYPHQIIYIFHILKCQIKIVFKLNLQTITGESSCLSMCVLHVIVRLITIKHYRWVCCKKICKSSMRHNNSVEINETVVQLGSLGSFGNVWPLVHANR